MATDELRAKLFINAKDKANVTWSEKRQSIKNEHPDWSEELVKEELCKAILERQQEMRIHIEKCRAESIANEVYSNEIIETLATQRQENLRKLDSKYRPVLTVDSVGEPKARKTVNKEDKALNAVVMLFKLQYGIEISTSEAREYFNDPTGFTTKMTAPAILKASVETSEPVKTEDEPKTLETMTVNEFVTAHTERKCIDCGSVLSANEFTICSKCN